MCGERERKHACSRRGTIIIITWLALRLMGEWMDRGKVRKMIIPEEEEKKRLGLKSKCFLTKAGLENQFGFRFQ